MERILTPVGWNLLFAAVLAIGTWLVGTLPLLRRRPTFLYMLWLLVLLKLIVPPLIPVPVLAPIPVAKVETIYLPPELVTLTSPFRYEPPVLAPAVPPPEFHLVDLLREPRFWVAALLIVSLSVTVVLWGLALRQQLRWQRLLNQKSQPTPERLQALARTAAEKLCCKTIPEIRLVDAGLTPFLWTGSGKLSVVLSPALVAELSDEQLLCVLMHELAHFKRRDHWGHLFAGWVTSLFWWNPVCWWAWRELRALQEICCDALVLRYSSDSRRLYAETLYAVLESLQTRKSVQPALSCSFGDSQHLRRRFKMLADTKLKPRLTPLTRLALLTLATLLPCLPTRAEPPEPEVEQAVPVAAEENDSNSEPIAISVKLSTQLDPEKGPEVLFPPKIKVFPGNEATISTELEPPGEKEDLHGKPIEGRKLTFMATPTLTEEGKVSLKLKYQVEENGNLRATILPTSSPLIMELNETKKVVLTGTEEKPTIWADVTVTREGPQPVRIRGKLNYQDSESKGPSTEFDTTVTLNDQKPAYVAGMLTSQSGKVDPEAKEKSLSIFAIQKGEKQIAVTVVIESDQPDENFKSTSLADYGKSFTTIFRRDAQNKPLVWLDLEVTPVSGAVPVATAEPVAAAVPPVPTPAPPPQGSIHRSLRGVVKTDKPADPNARYRLHLSSFVRTPSQPFEVLQETATDPILISKEETDAYKWSLQRSYQNGVLVEQQTDSFVTASIKRFPDFDNLVGLQLIFKRTQLNSPGFSRVNSPLKIPLDHKLALILERDKDDRPLHWLEIGVTELDAPAPEAYAVDPSPKDAPWMNSAAVAAAEPPVPTPAMELRIKTHPLPERFWQKPGGQWVSPKREEFQPILDHITQKISPESWSEKGGPARYELLLLDHSLVVLASPEMHEEIAAHLKKVWHAPAGKKEKHSLSIGISLTGPSLFGSPNLPPSKTTVMAYGIVEQSGKDPFGRPVSTREDYEKLLTALCEIEPKSWERNGGQGKIEYSMLSGKIIVENKSDVSGQVMEYCSGLMKKFIAAERSQGRPAPPTLQPIKPASLEVPQSKQPTPAKPASGKTQSSTGFPNPFYRVCYNVDQFLEFSPGRALGENPINEQDLNAMATKITGEVLPKSWKVNGGAGTIQVSLKDPRGACLVVNQTYGVHDQISRYLDQLRAKKGIDTTRNFSRAFPRMKELEPDKIQTIRHNAAGTLVTPITGKDGTVYADPVELEALINRIQQIEPQAWKKNGGPCSVEVTPDQLAITLTATGKVMEQVIKLTQLIHAERFPDVTYYEGPVAPMTEEERMKPYMASVQQGAAVSEAAPAEQELKNKLYVESFQVTDLIEVSEDRDLKAQPLGVDDLMSLREEIVSRIHPDAWKENGGPGQVQPTTKELFGQVEFLLLVKTRGEVFDSISEFLDEKRKAKGVENAPVRAKEKEKAPARNNDQSSRREEPFDADLPTLAEILKSLPPFEASPDSETVRLNPQVQIEMVRNETLPARFYPLVGPAKILKKEYKCTVVSEHRTTTKSDQPVSFGTKQAEVVYLDRNRMIRGE